MSRGSGGHHKSCDVADARARLHDAEAFLATADVVDDPDVKVTNAVHAGIAAADAICCTVLGQRSADDSHSAAVALLSSVDARLGNALNRALSRKNQAAYESRDVSTTDAAACVRQARTLTEAARARVQAI